MEEKRPKVGFGVMVLKKNKVLLGLRNPDPVKASSELHGEGTWTMPGGKLHFGETLIEGAKRELYEETGLHGETFEVVSVTDDIIPETHYLTIGLVCQKFSGEIKVKELREITEWRWFSFNHLPKWIYPPSLKVIKNYKKGMIYGA
jgi:ADP-ribose pyrophosphatase YjhB (NUDIX family)